MAIFEDANGNLHFGNKVSRQSERKARVKRFKESPGVIRLCMEWIANGGDLELWCRQRDLPVSSVRSVLLSDEWANDYAFAKRLRSHAIADKAERMLDDVAQGRIDPRTGDTVLKHARWFAAVYNADDYGEKRQVSHSHQLTIQDEHRETLRQLKDAREQEWADLAAVQDRQRTEAPALAGNVYDHGEPIKKDSE